MKKGRHRRFEEARALKRSNEVVPEPCPECGADPEDDHASWCLAGEEDEAVEVLGPPPVAGAAGAPHAGGPSGDPRGADAHEDR